VLVSTGILFELRVVPIEGPTDLLYEAAGIGLEEHEWVNVTHERFRGDERSLIRCGVG
jgi:hypothetical protein